VLEGVKALEGLLRSDTSLEDETRRSMLGAAQALRTMTQTAAITAPTDLWLMRQLLSFHARTGLLERLERGESVTSAEDRTSFGLQFFWTRGLLERSAASYLRSPSLSYALNSSLELPGEFRTDIAGLLCEGFRSSLPEREEGLVEQWLKLSSDST